jgi:hypothetical protein
VAGAADRSAAGMAMWVRRYPYRAATPSIRFWLNGGSMVRSPGFVDVRTSAFVNRGAG